MKHLTMTLALILGLISCKDNAKKPIDNSPLTEAQQTVDLDKVKIYFNTPILIDNSAYVVYPLILNNNEEERSELISTGYRSSTSYWNIIFYNTENGAYHLLDDKRKMVISTFYPSNSNAGSSSNINRELENGNSPVDNLLYYLVTTLDINNDGKLNDQDPNYLFISDKSGKNFKQISPENLHVTYWLPIKGTNKIIIQATKDSNNDHNFTEKDEIIPMVYDLNTNGISKDIFEEDFKISLKKQLEEHWKQKE